MEALGLYNPVRSSLSLNTKLSHPQRSVGCFHPRTSQCLHTLQRQLKKVTESSHGSTKQIPAVFFQNRGNAILMFHLHQEAVPKFPQRGVRNPVKITSVCEMSGVPPKLPFFAKPTNRTTLLPSDLKYLGHNQINWQGTLHAQKPYRQEPKLKGPTVDSPTSILQHTI